jgi:hypothetical protein
MPTRRIILFATFFVAVAGVATFVASPSAPAHAGQKTADAEYRVLDPLHSGPLTLYPVVRNADDGAAKQWNYITLDEGLRSGQVIVTEYGKLGRMVRPRHGPAQPVENYRADRVNTLVLVNNSDRPLMLLAGEIVTGGKQDRVIGRDRVVPAQSDPIDLSVFCIEHGRWTESSDKFGTAGREKVYSFMVQPSVRTRAMVQQDQQQVWDSVSRSVETASKAAAPAASPNATLQLGTTSYAKVLGDQRVQNKVDSVSEPLTRSNRELLQKLREEHAVGIVVAVDGELIWADIFATPEMLAGYWTKLVRSYAAESFDQGHATAKPATVADAQRFLDRPVQGSESSEGETGIYRYREVRGASESAFALRVLLPGTDFDAHTSRVVGKEDAAQYKLVPTLEYA